MKLILIIPALLSLSVLAGCEALQRAADSPLGQAAVHVGTSYLVSQAVESNPELTPIFLDLAEAQERDPETFSESLRKGVEMAETPRSPGQK